MWQSLSIAYRFKTVTPAVALIAVASALIAAPIVIRVIATAAYLTDGYAVIIYLLVEMVCQAGHAVIKTHWNTAENINQPFTYCI